MRSPILNTHVISGTGESEEEPTVPPGSDNETMWNQQMPDGTKGEDAGGEERWLLAERRVERKECRDWK